MHDLLFFVINGLRSRELVIVNYGFITPLCSGSSGSISVWGPVVGWAHTVAPCRVILQNSRSFIVMMAVRVCPSVSSILLKGLVLTYSFLLLLFQNCSMPGLLLSFPHPE